MKLPLVDVPLAGHIVGPSIAMGILLFGVGRRTTGKHDRQMHPMNPLALMGVRPSQSISNSINTGVMSPERVVTITAVDWALLAMPLLAANEHE